jgi:hypothetical protein
MRGSWISTTEIPTIKKKATLQTSGMCVQCVVFNWLSVYLEKQLARIAQFLIASEEKSFLCRDC